MKYELLFNPTLILRACKWQKISYHAFVYDSDGVFQPLAFLQLLKLMYDYQAALCYNFFISI